MAVSEAGYTQQVSPGGAAVGPVQAGPDAFGAGIGDAIEHGGDILQQAQMQHENAAAGLRAANARLAITKGVADLRATIGPDDPRYSQAVSDLVDQHQEDVLGSIANKRVLEAQRSQWGEFADQQKGEAYATQIAAQQVQAYANVDRQTDTGAARLALNPADHGAFGDEVLAVDHTIDNMIGPPALKEKAKAEAYQKLGISRFESWIQSDPVEAKRELETGGYNMYVGDKMPTLLHAADVAINQHQHAAEQAVGQQVKLLDMQRTDLQSRAPSAQEVASLADNYASLGERGASQAIEMRSWAQRISASDMYRGSTDAERQAAIANLLAIPQRSQVQEQTLKGLQEQAGLVRGMSTLQHYGYATGAAIAPLIINDPESVRSRVATLAAAQEKFGGVADPFLPGEEEPLKQLVSSPNRSDRISGAHAILQFGDFAGRALDRVAPQDHEFRSAIGLAALPNGAYLMDRALQASELARAHPQVLTPAKSNSGTPAPGFDQVYDQMMGGATALLSPDRAAALRDNTKNLYITDASQRGLAAFDPTRVLPNATFAAGGTASQDGQAGGVGTWNGQTVIIPRGMTQASFDRSLSRSTADDWGKASQGLPWVPSEHRTLQIRELRQLTPVMVRDGVYALRQGDGTYIAAKAGGRYLVDVGKLHGTAAVVSNPDFGAVAPGLPGYVHPVPGLPQAGSR